MTLAPALRWLQRCWGAGDDHLPLHLVHDLGWMLLQGREFRFGAAGSGAVARDYEDRVLGRWALDPTVHDAHVAVAGLPTDRRDAAVAHAVSLALGGPLRGAGLARGNAAHLRGCVVAESVDATWGAWASAQHDVAARALPAGRLFAPEDLWEIAHLAELPSESARLALRAVHAAAGRLGAASPTALRALRSGVRDVPVPGEEAGRYPAGGFDAVSTRGAFENLVRSEVAYVGEGAATPGAPDLFDVRFAEGELLYYTRDESPLRDARRTVMVMLHAPAAQRQKHADAEAQTLVLAEALAMGVHAGLVDALGAHGARTEIAYVVDGPGDDAAAAEGVALLSLALAAEVAHGRVALRVAKGWDDLGDGARVVFSPHAVDANVRCAAWVQTPGDAWRLGGSTWDAECGAASLRSLADAVLVALGGGGS